MKTITIGIVILIALFFVGCEKAELPQGYTVLCSFEGGKYSLRFPDGRISANIWSSEKGAINWAVYLEEPRNKPLMFPSDKYEWDECK